MLKNTTKNAKKRLLNFLSNKNIFSTINDSLYEAFQSLVHGDVCIHDAEHDDITLRYYSA